MHTDFLWETSGKISTEKTEKGMESKGDSLCEWKMDGAVSGLCAVEGFDIRRIEAPESSAVLISVWF
jgi:hypothetical protein